MGSKEADIYFALLIAIGVVAFVISYFIATLIRNQRRYIALYKQKINAEITTLESERSRIAADLHDDFGPFLSSIKMRISLLNTATPKEESMITKLKSDIDSMMIKIREISNNLVPSVLTHKGLVEALSIYCYHISQAGKVQVNFAAAPSLQLLQQQEIHIYRIVQEIINNAIKHAHCTVIDVTLFYKDGRLVLSITDDGIGFDKQMVMRQSAGLGLKNISSRADILKSALYIETTPGKGVHYQVEIPAQ
jgi:two-component system, NarL family, sensor kinase